MFKKGLITVLLVAIGVFAFSIAQAAQTDGLANAAGPQSPTNIYVNPDGLGDALIYGYYNARGSLDFLRVVNTNTSFGVAAKVRFREGRNSNEVFDFFICLSAGDQWSAFIGDFDFGNPQTSVANIIWWDNDTPTFPDPQLDNDATNNFAAVRPFSTAAATAVTPEDTKEGYAEIFTVSAWADIPGAQKVVKTPNQCGAVLGLTNVAGFVVPTLVDAPDSLFGNMYVFNLADLGTYAYNATALAQWRNTVFVGAGLGADDPPRIENATEGLTAVNYVLTKSVEYALYDITTLLDGKTTIINTFPTKRSSILNLVANGPFNDAATIDAAGAIVDAAARCERVGVLAWDDAENTPGSSVDFSPSRPTFDSKCDEVSLVVVGASGSPLLDSNLVQFNVNSPFDFGRVEISYVNVPGVIGRFTTVSGQTALGLPVISYELQSIVDNFFTAMLPLRFTTLHTQTVVPSAQ